MSPLARRRLRRFVAVLLAGLLGGLTVFAGAQVLKDRLQARQTELDRLASETQRLRALIRDKQTFEDEISTLETAIERAGVFASAPTRQQAFAQVQGYIDRTVTAAGGTVLRLDSEAARNSEAGEILPVGIQYTAAASAALDILAELENGRPMLMTQNLSIRALQVVGARAASAEPRLEVDARMEALFRAPTE